MSISAAPAHRASSCRSVPAKALNLLSFTNSSALAPHSHVLSLISTFLHNKILLRISETMDLVVNGSLDNTGEIRCHALRCNVTPWMLCMHRSAAQCMHWCALCWSWQNYFPANAQYLFSQAATATSVKKKPSQLMGNNRESLFVIFLYEVWDFTRQLQWTSGNSFTGW